jgi:ribosomal protein RSM22 (predicted rRNA methylase)
MPQTLIEAVASLVRGTDLAAETQALSARYRGPDGGACGGAGGAQSGPAKLAYLAARFPATFAAAQFALSHALDVCGDLDIRSVLDAGSGPGTASLAWRALRPDPDFVTLSDIDAGWRPLANALHAQAGYAAPRWLGAPLESAAYPAHDLVVSAYALNELDAAAQVQAAHNLWRASARLLVLVEPGTPKGFDALLRARGALIAQGAHVAAPCPHAAACPMRDGDWCHASVRLARSAAHRTAKGGTLPFEDEKLSYVAFAREPPLSRPRRRIVKRPVLHGGHVQLDLCGPEGLERRIVSRRDGDPYRMARKAHWGDGWAD